MNKSLPWYRHAAWSVAWIGLLVLIVVLGFGRFALGMLLPVMGNALSMGYDRMGYLSAGNFAGYMMAVWCCGSLVRRWGYRTMVSLGVATAAMTMVAMGYGGGFLWVAVAFFFTGIGSGLANVPIMGLAAHWFQRHWRGRAVGVMVCGNSIGIVITGLVVPMVNPLMGGDGWRWNWIWMGGVGVLVAIVAWAGLRDRPSDRGVDALGTGDGPDGRIQDVGMANAVARHRTLCQLAWIYFLFGFTYVVYVTFIVTTLVDRYGMSGAVAGRFWAILGGISLVSGPAFGAMSDRVGRRRTLATIFFLQAMAYGLVALPPFLPSLFLSIFLFGACAWAVPTVMAAAVADVAGVEQAAAVLGRVTLVFGLGQISGPAVAGLLAEATGGFAWSYGVTAFLAVVAVAISLRLPLGPEWPGPRLQ